jgi:hypothetical protein
MKVHTIGIMLILSTALFAQAPLVENVRFEQRTDGTLLVDIYYDVSDVDSDRLKITIEASDDDGATWTLPCTSLFGDVGTGISPGTDKHVVWDFYADNPNTSSDSYRIRVTADDEIGNEADITVEGGTLQITDTQGNIVYLTFPFGAVLETVHVSLSFASVDMDLPIDVRQVPVFEIRPLDINLYIPAEITIKYNTAISEIEKTSIFLVQSEAWLTPLGDHTFSDDGTSVTAKTLFFGDFAEGKMTFEQINTQLDSLDLYFGMSRPAGSNKPERVSEYCDTHAHKTTWDRYRQGFRDYLRYFVLISGLDPDAFNENVEWMCANIASRGVQEILDLCIPDNVCDTDYKHAIGTMTRDMMILGCSIGNPIFPSLMERFNQILADCGSYLTILSQLEMEDGAIIVFTSGYATLTMSAWYGNTAIVHGYGACDVVGGGGYGDCSAEVTGVTDFEVFGTRDALGNYNLTLNSMQDAIMFVVCGDLGAEVPLAGGDTYTVNLNPGNEYTEEIKMDVEGSAFKMDIQLINPWVGLPPE